MKAKEYMKRLDGIALEDAAIPMTEVVRDIVSEISQLIELRKAKTGSAVYSIVVELREKFTAFNKLATKKYGVQPLKDDSFDIFIKSAMPDVWEIIKRLEANHFR